jgi:hypothetical protein
MAGSAAGFVDLAAGLFVIGGTQRSCRPERCEQRSDQQGVQDGFVLSASHE